MVLREQYQTVSTMDGLNTFLLFDDYLGSSVNSTQWDTISGTPSVSSGFLSFSAAAQINSKIATQTLNKYIIKNSFIYGSFGIGYLMRKDMVIQRVAEIKGWFFMQTIQPQIDMEQINS